MKENINSNTIANTVRMGARSRRPRAVFLANDQADINLVQTVLNQKEIRVIPAHSRENAILAFEILVKAGYKGVMTAVNSQFDATTEQDVLGDGKDPKNMVSIEGFWEDVQKRGEMLMGHRVRVVVVEKTPQTSDTERGANTSMLVALSKVEQIRKDINPKPNRADYLREAREGAMYGLTGEV